MDGDTAQTLTLIALIAVVAVLLFGGSQLPKLARSVGQAQKEFRKGLTEGDTDARAVDQTTLGYYYLVRQESACGVAATFGRDSRGFNRVMGPASCSP